MDNPQNPSGSVPGFTPGSRSSIPMRWLQVNRATPGPSLHLFPPSASPKPGCWHRQSPAPLPDPPGRATSLDYHMWHDSALAARAIRGALELSPRHSRMSRIASLEWIKASRDARPTERILRRNPPYAGVCRPLQTASSPQPCSHCPGPKSTSAFFVPALASRTLLNSP